MTEQQAQAHWAVYGDGHSPVPGPGYWDWRCLACSTPVSHHPGLVKRWRLRRRRCTTCRQRMTAQPCVRNPLTGRGGHTYGGGVTSGGAA